MACRKYISINFHFTCNNKSHFYFMIMEKTVDLQQAKFIEQIIEKLHFDKDISKVLYLVEYGKSWYDKNFHGGSDM